MACHFSSLFSPVGFSFPCRASDGVVCATLLYFPQYTTTLGSDVNSIPTAIFNNSGTWIQTPSETANTHPITKTLGGYTYQALTADATTNTHTLLTNPTTHYMASDWCVLPNNPNTWIPYSSTITKTIYDPCPYGYRVPIDESWTGWATDTSKAWTQYAITGGLSWPTENGGWWPAAGSRNANSAILINISNNGLYWSSSPSPSAARNLAFNSTGWVNPNYTTDRSNRFSVRCIEKKKINKVGLGESSPL